MPRERVYEAELSDHLPQVYICGVLGNRVRVLSWNVLMKCCTSRKHTNNGFNKNETHTEFARRLQIVAAVIAGFFVDDPVYLPMVAALQECPAHPEQQASLMSEIRKRVPGLQFRAQNMLRNIANITLWDAGRWRLSGVHEPPKDGILSRALVIELAAAAGTALHRARCIMSIWRGPRTPGTVRMQRMRRQ